MINNFFVTEALESRADMEAILKEQGAEPTGMYTTGEMIFVYEVIGLSYVTGHITLPEFKQISKSFPIKTQPFKSVYKQTKKSEQVEVAGLRFDKNIIDHLEMLPMAISAMEKEPGEIPVARVCDGLFVFDDMVRADKFADVVMKDKS